MEARDPRRHRGPAIGAVRGGGDPDVAGRHGRRVHGRLRHRALPHPGETRSPAFIGRARRAGRETDMINTLARIDYLASTGGTNWHRASALTKLVLAGALVALAVFSRSLALLAVLQA